MSNEQMNIVFVGHVDHGKSTVIGRLLAETNTLPQGKLEKIKRYCELNAKPFEYAFLLDALKDEQAQGITIDIARCFLKTKKRHYLILDAPGHIEFLKNLVTGAANAEAAFLVIDAKEGIQENTLRHAYMLSLLQVKQFVVLINKIDLIHYDEAQYHLIRQTFSEHLKQFNIQPNAFIPISGQQGDNITTRSHSTPWYQGPTVLETLDTFSKQRINEQLPFRMQVQDVYKFTKNGDSRRIIVGQVNSGCLIVGSQVIFAPSGKTSRVKTIERFNAPSASVVTAAYSTGFTLCEQIYVKRGDVVFLANELPVQIATTLVVSLFWLGRNPLCLNKEYGFKLGPSKVKMKVLNIIHVIDTATLALSDNPDSVKVNQAAECTIQLFEPIAYDNLHANDSLKRFVIVDAYDIAGGGTILSHIDDNKTKQQAHLYQRNLNWTISGISYKQRCKYYQQTGEILWFTGLSGAGKTTLATLLESTLLEAGRVVCLLDGDSLRDDLNSDLGFSDDDRKENIRRIGSLAIYLAKQAVIVIVSAISPHQASRDNIRQKALKEQLVFTEIYVKASIKTCQERDPKGLYQAITDIGLSQFTGIDSIYEIPTSPEIILNTENDNIETCIEYLIKARKISAFL